MFNLTSLLTSATCPISSLSSSPSPPWHACHDVSTPKMLSLMTTKVWNGEHTGIQFRRAQSSFRVVKASGMISDPTDDWSASSGTERKDEDETTIKTPIVSNSPPEAQQEGIILSSSGAPLKSLTQDMAMGLVLRAAAGTGWTTDSGLEGPGEVGDETKDIELKFPDLSKSPRRKMRVAFTCNVCGHRTIRAINPLAYTDGTVFVQCKGCDVFHKLVDNLNLFHEMRGKIYRGHDIPWYANEQPYNFFDGQYPLL